MLKAYQQVLSIKLIFQQYLLQQSSLYYLTWRYLTQAEQESLRYELKSPVEVPRV